MNKPYFESLNNQFLVAMPELADRNFSRTVTLICQHDSNGAIGIIVNRTIESLSINDVLNQCSLPKANSTSVGLQPIHNGGPVHPELGLVLHRNNEKWDSTLYISQDLHLTSSRDALEAIGQKGESRNYLLALGYAGWSAGQLDSELKQNSWLTVPADPRIIFDVSVEKRWLEAIAFLGIDVANLSVSGGHA